MLRQLRHGCRLGIFVLAAVLAATGLSARTTRDLRTPRPSPIAEVVETPSIDLQIAGVYALLKPLGMPVEVQDDLRLIADAALAGGFDDAAIDSAAARMTDPVLRAQADLILQDFAAALVVGIPAVSADGVPSRLVSESRATTLSAGDLAHIQRVTDLRAQHVAAAEAIEALAGGSAFDHVALLARIDASAADGFVEQAIIDEAASMIADPALGNKLSTVLSNYANNRAAVAQGIDAPALSQSVSRSASQIEVPGGGNPDLGGRAPMVPLACGTCAAPGGTLAAPTLACQLVSGNTTSCGSPFREVYNVTLTAGQSYTFTMCTATCAGATASYDSRLILWDPTCTTQLFNNDDFCGLLSEGTATATVSGVHKIEVTGFTATNSGTYTMGYRLNPPSTCGSCVAPLTTITPTPVCQTNSNSNTSCPSTSTATTTTGGVWYNANLTAGRTYTFSTCPNLPGACNGTATFDTRLDLWNSACATRLATNDDASGCSQSFRSSLSYSAAITGVHKLQVRGFTTQTGTYTLAYQELAACQSPTITALNPLTGNTNQTTCGVTQTFTATLSANAAAGTVTFNVTPPAGGTVSPAGAVTVAYATGQTSVTNTRTLTRAGCGNPQNFTVTAQAAATCAPTVVSTRTITYGLFDRTGPAFSGVPANITINCTAPVPPPANPTATDVCGGPATVTFSETTTTLNCPGNRNIVRTWTARDCNANTTTARQTISIRDTTPPTVSGPGERCLHPPNHEFHCYTPSDFSPVITDDCSLPTSFLLVGCSSNEPDEGTGDGDFPIDCVIAPDGSQVCVRAERAGNLNDRVYTLLGVALDACGNRTGPVTIATVTVFHDDSEHPECDRGDAGFDKRF